MYIYICLYIDMYICLYSYICIYIYICKRINIEICICIGRLGEIYKIYES